MVGWAYTQGRPILRVGLYSGWAYTQGGLILRVGLHIGWAYIQGWAHTQGELILRDIGLYAGMYCTEVGLYTGWKEDKPI